MKSDNCVVNLENLYRKLAWITFTAGIVFLLKLMVFFLSKEWQTIIKSFIPYISFFISVLFIKAMWPNLLKKTRRQSNHDEKQIGVNIDILNQSMVFSWCVTLCGIMLLQAINKVVLQQQISAESLFNIMFALMTLSASLSFLFLNRWSYGKRIEVERE